MSFLSESSFLADRPARALVGALCFSLAAGCVWWRDGVAPDPLIAGVAAPVLFLGIATVAMLLYAGVVVSSLVTRRNA